MSPELITILMFVFLFIGIFLGFPIAFTLTGLAFAFGYIAIGEGIFNLFAHRIYGVMTEYIYVALPLFVFMGCMLERSGVAEAAYDYLYGRFGHIKGGLAIATVILCVIFAASTGVVGAAVSAMGLIALPAMINRNYDKKIASGVVGAGGTLGILIPPSIMLVLYAPMGGVSLVRLFAAAIVPGLLLGAFYIAYVLLVGVTAPEKLPALPKGELEKPSLLEGLKTFVPFVLLIVSVLGLIFFGIAAPTEAAGMGAFGSIVVAAINRKLSFGSLYHAAITTLRLSAMILFVAVGATLFTTVFYRTRADHVVVDFLAGFGLTGYALLAAVLFLVFFLGMFIDWVGVLLIITPIFVPILVAEGFNPLWVGMLMMVLLQSSFLTPPFAYTLFYIKGVAPKSVTLSDIYLGAIPFVIIQLIVLLLCIFIPAIITWLPAVLY